MKPVFDTYKYQARHDGHQPRGINRWSFIRKDNPFVRITVRDPMTYTDAKRIVHANHPDARAFWVCP